MPTMKEAATDFLTGKRNDPGHQVMRAVFTLTGNVPRRVP